MKKDWIGSQHSLFAIMGSSSHSAKDREIDDFYATDPEAIDGLAKMIDIPHVVLEPACGMGHLSKRLEELGHKVYSYDKVDRGYGKVQDFFFMESLPEDCSCIITNQPYRQHLEFILKALELLPDGGLCCMFSKTIYLEGVDRYEKLYRNNPPHSILQFVRRVRCGKNGVFDIKYSAVAYAWFVWKKGYKGDTIVKWI